MRRSLVMAAAALLAVPGAGAAQAPSGGAADTVSLSLPDAVGRATGQSEEVRLARSQVELADVQVRSARSQALPQVNANLGYTRTFASAFSGGGGFTLPDSLRFEPDPTAPLEERVRYLEDNAPLAGLGGLGSLFGDLPFGQENAYAVSLSGSQLLYSGGRVGAALNIARSYRQAAQLQLVEETAEIELQVRSAYYQALLAGELAGSASAALAQAQEFLEQEQLRRRAGQASELDVLRAQVARDNLRPQLVQARNAADLALLDLKRLTDVPLAQPVRLTTPLAVPAADVLESATPAAEVSVAQRAAVAAAERQVAIREQQVRIARGAFLPDVSLQMNYGRQLFPAGVLDLASDWRTDWTATVGVSVPVFTGFRRSAEVQQARVELEQSRLQVAQLRENVQLQYEQARAEKERARAEITARQTTVEVAERVYDLTVLRYRQGLATQLEVNSARLELLQARTNLAQAVAGFYIADAGITRASAGAGGAPPAGPVPATQAPPAPAQAGAPQQTAAPRNPSTHQVRR